MYRYKYFVTKNSQGFSMIEVIITMGIMAILMSVIIIGLSSSKQDAKNDVAYLAANETVNSVLDCMDRNQVVSNANPLCSGGKNRATLPSGWVYAIITGSAATKIYDVQVSATGKTIRCTNNTAVAGFTADGKCRTTGM